MQRILLMGTDMQGSVINVSADEQISRADVILLLAVKPGFPDIRILNIERDYLVELPDEIGANKLSTATYFGGEEMLLNAVNSLFDLDIRFYIQTDIGSIPRIIDSVGGVDVEVFNADILSFSTSYYKEPVLLPGVNHFNGIQAQNFIRFRDEEIDAIESNKQRNERHMRVISAFLDRFLLLSLDDTLDTLVEISSQVHTNISFYDLMKLLQAISVPGNLMDRLNFMNSPDGAYVTRLVKMHKVVVVENMQEEQHKVREFLFYPVL